MTDITLQLNILLHIEVNRINKIGIIICVLYDVIRPGAEGRTVSSSDVIKGSGREITPNLTVPNVRLATAHNFGCFWITTWKTRQKYSPFDLAGGGGGRLHEVWFGLFSQRL
jgi:hypothetical protein